MDSPHYFCIKPSGLIFRFQPVYHLFAKPMQVKESEFFQQSIPDVRLDLVIVVPSAGLLERWLDFEISIVLEPAF